MESSDGVKAERPTPADGDDYTWAPSAGTGTYDLRTGPERTQAQLDDLAFRLRTLTWAPSAGTGTYDLRTGPERTQAQLDDLAFRLRTLEAQYSQEIRTLAERLQQVEYVLDQYAGDHR